MNGGRDNIKDKKIFQIFQNFFQSIKKLFITYFQKLSLHRDVDPTF